MCDKGIERSIQVSKSGPSNVDEQYFGIVKTIMKEDCVKRDRTGTGTISTFGTRMVLDIRDGKVPLLTSKKVYHRAIIHELLWMLSGNTDIRYLKENNVNIWDSWVDPKTAEYDAEGKLVAGNLPHIYQAQWRAWDDTRVDDPNAWEPVVTNRKIDQIAMIIDQLKNNPDSRRILLSAWNVSYIEEMALPPCFPSGTMISTPNGYKAIETIETGDIVFSATMKPRVVNNNWKTPYHGNMTGIRLDYSPGFLLSTPNHPHLVINKGYTKAENIEKDDKMVMPLRNTDISREVHSFTYKERSGGNYEDRESTHVLTIQDYYMLGYFVGNGWFMANSGNRVCFAIPNHKVDSILPKIRESIKVSIKGGGDSENVATYETRSNKWSYLLPEFGKYAPNKQIPEWLFNSPLEYIEMFLNGYMDADGCIGPNEYGKRFTTTSKKLAFGLQRLFAMFGKAAGVTYQKRSENKIIEGRFVKQNDTYTIRVSGIQQKITNIYHDSHMEVAVRENHSLHTVEELFVYNLDVEEEHTYIANNFATHNCHVLYQLWTRELSFLERVGYYHKITGRSLPTEDAVEVVSIMDERGIPKRAISSQMYQR